MSDSRTLRLATIFHAIVIGTYVPIRLYVANQTVVPLAALWIPFCLSLAIAVVLLFVTRLFLETLTARAIGVSFICFGLMPLLEVRAAVTTALPAMAHPVGQLAVVGVCFLVIGATAVWLVRRMSQSGLNAARDGLNGMALVLIVLNLIGVVTQRPSRPWLPTVETLVAPVRARGPGRRMGENPDIYYIILDGYARDDVLVDRYGVSPNPLTQYLTDSGFFVAHGSQANYLQTYLSLASSLNMVYLDPLADTMLTGADRRPLGHLIQNNVVVSHLNALGYTTVLASSDYYATARMADVDICFCDVLRPTEFDMQWLARTPLGAVPSVTARAYAAHREKVTRTLEFLQRPPGESPRFVFAHLLVPHPPFVFRPDGEPVQPPRLFSFHDGNHFMGRSEEYVEGYREQLTFVNTGLRTVIDAIRNQSDDQAIIIVQSDHGPGSGLDWESASRTDVKERSGILSAYYLPGEDDETLYDTISPVNTFRVIFNKYFQASYDLLPDRSYFSTWPEPYRFLDVTQLPPAGSPRLTAPPP